MPKPNKRRVVDVEQRQGMVFLWLRSGLAGNRMDDATDSALCRTLEDLAFDDGVRVVVVAAREGDFCLGAAQALTPGTALQSIQALARLECPTLAVIQGGAVAEGCELALACDLRLAATRSYFALPQLRAGQFPCHGATQRLPRLIGRMRALDMLWTGRRVSAREAWRWGLVNAVVPSRQLYPEAERLARTLAERAPLGLRFIKEAVGKGLDGTLEQGMRLEEDLYALLQTTTDWRRGIAAFRRKTRARFLGR